MFTQDKSQKARYTQEQIAKKKKCILAVIKKTLQTTQKKQSKLPNHAP